MKKIELRKIFGGDLRFLKSRSYREVATIPLTNAEKKLLKCKFPSTECVNKTRRVIAVKNISNSKWEPVGLWMAVGGKKNFTFNIKDLNLWSGPVR